MTTAAAKRRTTTAIKIVKRSAGVSHHFLS
jgi:hypothetical protein